METKSTRIPTIRDTFDRLVARSIEKNDVHRDLLGYCRKLGLDYNEVVEHIAAEVAANRAVAE